MILKARYFYHRFLPDNLTTTKSSTNYKFNTDFIVNDTTETGNVQNLTTFCQANYLPSVEEYFTGKKFPIHSFIHSIDTLSVMGEPIIKIFKHSRIFYPSPNS